MSMHGQIESFEVEPDGQHVIVTVTDPSEGHIVTVRVSKTELATMADAKVFYSDGPPQTPTTLVTVSCTAECDHAAGRHVPGRPT
jgi:hypothetical protein